ncbi:MAG: hypothetical protein LUD50_01065 [Clostridia bacterium]|nr:hypothetical protein [Clostridia bacterium]
MKTAAPKDAPVPDKDAPKEAPKSKAPIPTEDDEKAPQKATPKEAPKEMPVANAAPAPKRQPVTIGSLSQKPDIVPEEEEDDDENMSVEDRVNAVRDRDEERKNQIVPDNEDDVNEVIGNQSMDIKELMDIIDTLLAERDYNKQKADSADEDPKKPLIDEPEDDEDIAEDSEDDSDEEDYSDDEEYDEDEDDEDPEDDEDDSEDDEDEEDEPEDEDYTEEEDSEDEEPEDDEDYEEDEDEEPDDSDYKSGNGKYEDVDFGDDDDEENEDSCEGCGSKKFNSRRMDSKKIKVRADSVDKIVRQRIKVGMIGRTLNLDGLENMPLTKAKKKVIHAVNPGLRLDGKSPAYINAAYDVACADIAKKSKKDTNYQKKQMFNADGRRSAIELDTSDSARQRMIKKMTKEEDR